MHFNKCFKGVSGKILIFHNGKKPIEVFPSRGRHQLYLMSTLLHIYNKNRIICDKLKDMISHVENSDVRSKPSHALIALCKF